MTTWAELREEAERTIELRRDVEYAGGQALANMILDMDDPLERIAQLLASLIGETEDGVPFLRVVDGATGALSLRADQ